MEYYIIQNDTQIGPLSRDQLLQAGLTAQTPVWRQGMADWKPAGELPELANLLYDALGRGQTPPTLYYAMLHGVRVGPVGINDLISAGLTADTMVWAEGMQAWAPARTVPALQQALADAAMRRGAGFRSTGTQYAAYGTPGQGEPIAHTNWLTWAIVGTVVGFMTSCIGAIFGIIGIVQANKANEAYASGDAQTGGQANSTAKTMVVISLIFSALGIISVVIGSITGLLSLSALTQ